MKKVTILFVGALAALLSLAPVAGAHGKRHARTVTVCGIVDAHEFCRTRSCSPPAARSWSRSRTRNHVVLDA